MAGDLLASEESETDDLDSDEEDEEASRVDIEEEVELNEFNEGEHFEEIGVIKKIGNVESGLGINEMEAKATEYEVDDLSRRLIDCFGEENVNCVEEVNVDLVTVMNEGRAFQTQKPRDDLGHGAAQVSRLEKNTSLDLDNKW